MHICSRNSNVRNDKKNMKENVPNEKRGRWSICLPKIVPYAEARCISVKGNTVNSLAVAIILIAKAQERYNKYRKENYIKVYKVIDVIDG